MGSKDSRQDLMRLVGVDSSELELIGEFCMRPGWCTDKIVFLACLWEINPEHEAVKRAWSVLHRNAEGGIEHRLERGHHNWMALYEYFWSLNPCQIEKTRASRSQVTMTYTQKNLRWTPWCVSPSNGRRGHVMGTFITALIWPVHGQLITWPAVFYVTIDYTGHAYDIIILYNQSINIQHTNTQDKFHVPYWWALYLQEGGKLLDLFLSPCLPYHPPFSSCP